VARAAAYPDGSRINPNYYAKTTVIPGQGRRPGTRNPDVVLRFIPHYLEIPGSIVNAQPLRAFALSIAPE